MKLLGILEMLKNFELLSCKSNFLHIRQFVKTVTNWGRLNKRLGTTGLGSNKSSKIQKESDIKIVELLV